MTRFQTNAIAAFAAVFLAITSIGTIVTVPPAQAQTASDITTMIELA